MANTYKTRRLLFTGPFLTLKIVFIDLLIAICRLVSEINQGFALLLVPETRNYGIATFIVSWAPGITFAIYILSKYRRMKEWPWYKIMFWAASSVLMYPIVPIFSIFHFLWNKPEDTCEVMEERIKSIKDEEMTNDLKDVQRRIKEANEAKIRLRIAQAIHGGIAAPLQLCYQLWLAINGILTLEDKGIIFSVIKLQDWEGNEVTIPTAAPVCIFFTCIT